MFWGGENLTEQLSKKAQAILIYLAMTEQTHERVWIASLFWPEMPDRNAKKNLRDILPTMRKLVGSHLIITRQTLALDLERPYFVDVARFETLLASAEKDQETLYEAMHLYRGEFLEGFQVLNSPAFEDWSISIQARLHELAVQNMGELLEQCVAQQDLGLWLRHFATFADN